MHRALSMTVNDRTEKIFFKRRSDTQFLRILIIGALDNSFHSALQLAGPSLIGISLPGWQNTPVEINVVQVGGRESLLETSLFQQSGKTTLMGQTHKILRR